MKTIIAQVQDDILYPSSSDVGGADQFVSANPWIAHLLLGSIFILFVGILMFITICWVANIITMYKKWKETRDSRR